MQAHCDLVVRCWQPFPCGNPNPAAADSEVPNTCGKVLNRFLEFSLLLS
jgi:hypothetical protein